MALFSSSLNMDNSRADGSEVLKEEGEGLRIECCTLKLYLQILYIGLGYVSLTWSRETRTII